MVLQTSSRAQEAPCAHPAGDSRAKGVIHPPTLPCSFALSVRSLSSSHTAHSHGCIQSPVATPSLPLPPTPHACHACVTLHFHRNQWQESPLPGRLCPLCLAATSPAPATPRHQMVRRCALCVRWSLSTPLGTLNMHPSHTRDVACTRRPRPRTHTHTHLPPTLTHVLLKHTHLPPTHTHVLLKHPHPLSHLLSCHLVMYVQPPPCPPPQPPNPIPSPSLTLPLPRACKALQVLLLLNHSILHADLGEALATADALRGTAGRLASAQHR